MELDHGDSNPQTLSKGGGSTKPSNHVASSSSTNGLDEPLFSPTLIPTSVAATLPDGYSIRPLQRDDIEHGFLDVLRVLTVVGGVSREDFTRRFDEMRAATGIYHVIVICDKDVVVATGMLFVEKKFIHENGLVGHIEDVAVNANQQGKQLGKTIIRALDHIAKQTGCYKIILNCSKDNENFYVKCGFKNTGLEMAHYFIDG